jgi:hypothetical protein
MFVIEAHFGGSRKLLLGMGSRKRRKVIGVFANLDVLMVMVGQQGVLLLVEWRLFVGEVFGKLHGNNRSNRVFISFALLQHDVLELSPRVPRIAVAVLMVDQVALDDGLRGKVNEGKVDARHDEGNESSYDSYH